MLKLILISLYDDCKQFINISVHNKFTLRRFLFDLWFFHT